MAQLLWLPLGLNINRYTLGRFCRGVLSYLKAADTQITFPPLQYLTPVQPKKKKMGGGNGQKAKMAREKNLEKQKAGSKGSQLESNKKAMSIQGACRSQAPQN
ncbi:hypothetical protein OIU84_012997 [Salix udensis]|uniref:Small EDRK-rich factor-like N-terminal domain-containing protein n=1 Tax=Salix udensis TaxID=889485 RepID=A0AAD6JGZ9_9ROSI|nr:hypothetical protein OIU84_012997 [Salix udensis]